MPLFTRRMAAVVLAAGCFAVQAWAADAPKVKFTTTAGDFVVEVYPDKAPKTVANFLEYVRDKHYDGTIFHRVINGFMIQGGGFDRNMVEKKTRPPVVHEGREAFAKGLRNQVGTIAMARTSDPNSATSQFFINVADNGFLNFTAPTPQGWGYCVFGKVAEGRDVVDKIRKVRTGSRGMHQDVPVEDVVIERAEVV